MNRDTKKEVTVLMNKAKLGYGLLREFISKGFREEVINQADSDIRKLNKKIMALRKIKDIVKNS